MFEITLSKQQTENLLIFLARVTLKGNEVGAYNELDRAIRSARPVEVESAEAVTSQAVASEGEQG